MRHHTLACILALLSGALALNASPTARAALIEAFELNYDDHLFLTQPATADTLERMNAFFANNSLLAIEFQNSDMVMTTQLFRLTNNPDDIFRISGDLSLVSCDGSVFELREACDGSVTPAKQLQLSLEATLNSHVWMSGTLWDFSLNGDPYFGIAAVTGNPFGPDTDLMGMFDIATIDVDQVRSISDFVIDPDPTLEVTVRAPEIRDYYFFGMVDFLLEHRTNSNDPPIPQGQSRDFLDPIDHESPSYFTCASCDFLTVGVGFSSPGRGGNEEYGSTRTRFEGRFSIEEGSAVRIPLPGTAWLLLAGLGALGVFGRRRQAGTA